MAQRSTTMTTYRHTKHHKFQRIRVIEHFEQQKMIINLSGVPIQFAYPKLQFF